MSTGQFSIQSSPAIVTGASSGIGEAIAKRFAEDGVDIAICSREQERVDRVADEIADSDCEGRAMAVECDVRDTDAVDAFVDAVAEEFGGVGVLVNNAAGTFRSDFEDLSPNAWGTIIDINLNGTFNCTRAAGRHMREAGHGVVINFSSVAALGPSPRTSHYAASKAAIDSLTQSLAVEWAEHDIRVNCIAPGLIATPPVRERLGLDEADLPDRDHVDRHIGFPEEIADVAQFLASPAASYLTGHTIVSQGVPPEREEKT
jgi:NAD(P)-dependent dehydrogenase (short-subunit alcohol dehydrogenase family)